MRPETGWKQACHSGWRIACGARPETASRVRPSPLQKRAGLMRRMGMVIGIRPGRIAEYRRLHAAVWPAVLARIAASNIRNYTIFLREPENLLFGYWEYHGDDFAADSAAIAADPVTQDWWKLCGPCQAPLASRADGDWWAMMEEVFHTDLPKEDGHGTA